MLYNKIMQLRWQSGRFPPGGPKFNPRLYQVEVVVFSYMAYNTLLIKAYCVFTHQFWVIWQPKFASIVQKGSLVTHSDSTLTSSSQTSKRLWSSLFAFHWTLGTLHKELIGVEHGGYYPESHSRGDEYTCKGNWHLVAPLHVLLVFEKIAGLFLFQLNLYTSSRKWTNSFNTCVPDRTKTLSNLLTVLLTYMDRVPKKSYSIIFPYNQPWWLGGRAYNQIQVGHHSCLKGF